MAVDMFLKLTDIKGESFDSKHKDQIEILSFSWGMSQSSTQTGGGGGTGKVSIQDLTFTKVFDKSSPQLMLACANGKHIASAVLFCRKAGKDQQDFLMVTMSDCLISSYQVGGHSSGGPTDAVSLNFAKIQWSYRAQNRDGSLAAPEIADITNSDH